VGTVATFTQALRRWPRDGVPDRPGAWLMTVARNGAIDRLRRGTSYRAKVEELAVMATRQRLEAGGALAGYWRGEEPSQWPGVGGPR
jgi:predicted RNA polymerase sigma factor